MQQYRFILLVHFFFFFLNPFFSSSQKILSSFNSKSPPWKSTQNQILLSPNSTFAAGFLQSSSNSFNFSIWYYKIPIKTIVWSANPNSPLNSSATLFISPSGELKLTSNPSSSAPNLWPSTILNTSSVLFLQEDGNLVYGNWNSFFNPTDTYLPTQNITGTNLTSGNGKFHFDGSNSNTLFYNRNDSYFTFSQNALQRLEETGEVTQVNGRFFSSNFGEKGKLRRMKLDDDGKGGFGDVYKGKLSDGRVVAVKCLKNVKGGDAEFWAEVTIIARMHHLNLVRLWGFCAEKGRRILVYEYVPNGSLGEFLFQKAPIGSPDGQKPILDWNIRYRIALGVARAIAYLHEECLEWVLHCDIKPENILLGDDFCPKVSDFGLAKLKKKEEMMTMSRFRGTPGYVAPEWTKADPITPKADVYSFGLVLLEIVSGSRNFEHHNSKVESDQWFFPAWAFDKVFKDMKVDDILDPRIKQSYDSRAHFDLVNRMVKTAMWCIQDRPDARPSMGKVAKMLEGTVEIIEPKKPTIFFLSEE